MGGVVLVTLGAVVLIACTILIWREKEAAKASAAEAEIQRRRAEESFSHALFGAWQLIQHLEDTRLNDDGPKARAACGRNSWSGVRSFFQAFVHEESNDPIVRFESARACELLASVYCTHRTGRWRATHGEPGSRALRALCPGRPIEFDLSPKRSRNILFDGYALLLDQAAALGRAGVGKGN